MPQQTINIGAVANDGTGDPARTAFGKVNSNFSEIYGLVGTAQTAADSAIASAEAAQSTADGASIFSASDLASLDIEHPAANNSGRRASVGASTKSSYISDGTEWVAVVTATTDPVTGGMGFNGTVVDMSVTPDDTNTATYPVGTLFISPVA